MNCIIYVGSYRFVKNDLLFGRNRLGLITLMFFFSTISIMTEKGIGDNVRKGFLYNNNNNNNNNIAFFPKQVGVQKPELHAPV